MLEHNVNNYTSAVYKWIKISVFFFPKVNLQALKLCQAE